MHYIDRWTFSMAVMTLLVIVMSLVAGRWLDMMVFWFTAAAFNNARLTLKGRLR